MKKSLFVLFVILATVSIASAADFALKGQWNPNTETDMSYYVIYRTDSGRVPVSACSHVNQPALPLPAHVECPFVVTIPNGTEPTLSFVLVAVDTTGNTSIDSATATFRADAKGPGQPASFVIIFQ